MVVACDVLLHVASLDPLSYLAWVQVLFLRLFGTGVVSAGCAQFMYAFSLELSIA